MSTTATIPGTSSGTSLPVHELESAFKPSLWQRYKKYRYFSDPRLNSWPSFRTVFKAKLVDSIIISLVGTGIQLSYNKVSSARTTLFALHDPSLSKPQLPIPLGVHTDIWLTLAIPEAIFFLIFALWIRSFWDLINVTTGHGFSIAIATLFQLTIKKFTGRLRPHFYDVCRPSPDANLDGNERLLQQANGPVDRSWRKATVQLYDISICVGEDGGGPASVPDHVFESFPSGHATAAFAAAVYMSLYLNGKMKLWPERAQSKGGVKMLVVFAPILLASLMPVAMFKAGWHHASDVIFGAIIGTFFAIVSYRMVYVSVLDSRTNHLPLLDDILAKQVEDDENSDGGSDGSR